MLLSFATLSVFIPIMVIASVSPGPDVLYIISKAGQGRASAAAACMGVATGVFAYCACLAFGLGQLFDVVPQLFVAMKIGGAGYLLYLAYKILKAPAQDRAGMIMPQKQSLWQVYRGALLTNLLNPKAIIVLSALLTQFVNPEMGHLTRQYLELAIVTTVVIFITQLIMGMAIAAVMNKIKQQTKKWVLTLMKASRYVLAALFSWFALRLVTSEK